MKQDNNLLPEPRDHHYMFAHNTVRELCLHDPLWFFGALGEKEHQQMVINKIWEVVNDNLSGKEAEFDINETLVETTRIQNYPSIIITMPEPRAAAEAYMIGLVLKIDSENDKNSRDIPVDYFTLELGQEPHGSLVTYFCNWEDGNHGNFGFGPKPELQEFVTEIEKVILVKQRRQTMLGKLLGRKTKKPRWTINMHSSLQDNPGLTAAWMVYGCVIAGVRDGSYFDDHPEAKGMDTPFDEECFARDHLAEIWATHPAEEQSTDPYLKLLVEIREAGLVREYVWKYLLEDGWPIPQDLDLDKLDALMAPAGGNTHQPVTLSFVVPK